MYAMIKRSFTPYDPRGELQRLKARHHIFHVDRIGQRLYRLDNNRSTFWEFGELHLNLFPDDTIFLHTGPNPVRTGTLEQVLSYLSDSEERDWHFYPVSNERDITYGPSRRGRKHSANPKHDRWRVISIGSQNRAEPVGVSAAVDSGTSLREAVVRAAELSLGSLQLPLHLTQGETLATIFGVST